MDDFHKMCTLTLEEAADFFESSWKNADVDLLGDILTVTLTQNQQYVIHKHGITRQIWLASPFTGAHHFRLIKEEWRCTRTNSLLQEFLLREKKNHAA